MTIRDIPYDECTGCLACVSICHKNAIQTKKDKEGFWIPVINQELCVNCGKCYQYCPGQNNYKNKIAEETYVVSYRNKTAVRKSASGGAFASIANFLIKQKNAVVIGASLCDDLVVRHISIEKVKDIKKCQNSKYVQSYTEGIYEKVKQELDKGKVVFFTGTPCQVSGLYSVITNRQKERLYTADLVCHGVPSPEFLNRQLREEMKEKRNVKSFKFRFKNPICQSFSLYYWIMYMKKGLPIIRRTVQTPYYNLFMLGKSLRESCYNCKYSCMERVGDFTFGDCDSNQFYPDFHPNESNSILLLNTEKARKLWGEERLSENFDWCPLDLKREAEYNHQLTEPVKRPEERSVIYDEVFNMNWEDVKKKYSQPQRKYEQYKLLLVLFIPRSIIRFMSKIKSGNNLKEEL